MGVVKLSTAGILDYQKYSDFLAGNFPANIGVYDLLTTTIVGSTAVASVTFDTTPYSSTYKHLQLRVSHIQSISNETALLQVNGDTASNYRVHALRGNGSTVTSADYGSRSSLVVGVDVPSTTIPAAFVCDILDAFSTTKNTTFRTLAGYGSGGNINLVSGLWLNTNAITEVKVLASSGNFSQYSRFSLYGLKG